MSKIRTDNLLVLISKVYTASIGVILLPYFLEVLGKEQYGLVGSFVILQACLQILDAGISGVLTRQSIMTQKNYESFIRFIGVLKYILFVFLGISLLIVFFGKYFAERYSTNWFNSNLDDAIIISSVSFMFAIFSLRYLQGPLKSILLSFEKHKILALNDMLYISLSGPLTLFILYRIKGDITDFFVIQLIAISFSLITIATYTWFEILKVKRKLSAITVIDNDEVQTNISGLIKFGGQLSLLSMLWVIVNQSDKVTLTKYMELSEYSFYAISISILGVMRIFVSTMIQTVRPRLITYLNNKELDRGADLFKNSVISLVSITLPLVVFLSYYGEDLLLFWTGNTGLSSKVMRYLPYLLLGTFFVSMSEFSFMLLYSTGKLKVHTIFYSIVSLLLIPLNVFVASEYLGDGSAKLFLLVNIILFSSWSLYNIRMHLTCAVRLFALSFICSVLCSLVMIYLSSLVVGSVGISWFSTLIFFGVLSITGAFFSLKKLARFINVRVKKDYL